MVHRVKKDNDVHLGKWNGLGGKLEAGETPEECAIREILEEHAGGGPGGHQASLGAGVLGDDLPSLLVQLVHVQVALGCLHHSLENLWRHYAAAQNGHPATAVDDTPDPQAV